MLDQLVCSTVSKMCSPASGLMLASSVSHGIADLLYMAGAKCLSGGGRSCLRALESCSMFFAGQLQCDMFLMRRPMHLLPPRDRILQMSIQFDWTCPSRMVLYTAMVAVESLTSVVDMYGGRISSTKDVAIASA